ncbi:MAG: hypothetical protein DMF78_08560 [Acidobacteria bacterium]|nr:MAG: hypothetical protein DMF78_08560 [Acidobacteriota bacterium]
MGLPGAGKSTLAAELVGRGYERLNRDEAGGRLSDLIPALRARLRAGRRRVVLDNTYGSRAARNAVIEAAWRHGVPVRCVWLRTSVEDAQVNAVQRLITRYGRLLGPEEIARASRDDPGAFAPGVLFRHRREQEAPDMSEGFARVDSVPFERSRRRRRGHHPDRARARATAPRRGLARPRPVLASRGRTGQADGRRDRSHLRAHARAAGLRGRARVVPARRGPCGVLVPQAPPRPRCRPGRTAPTRSRALPVRRRRCHRPHVRAHDGLRVPPRMRARRARRHE